MGILNLVLIGVGVAGIVYGYSRARGPWARYQALKAQDENIARYESWRGGLRDSGTTGASIAMDLLRKQARENALIAVGGFIVVIVGLALH
jgi:hypothetical protein